MPNRFNLSIFALPAQQLLSGATAAAGVALVALATGLWLGAAAAAVVAVGATCASIVDTPAPPGHKRIAFLIVIVFDSLVTLGIGLSEQNLAAQAGIVALTSFVAAMLTIYGKTMLALCMSMILSMVFAFGVDIGGGAAAVHHALLFFAGAVAYAVFGMGMSHALEARHKQIALTGTLDAFAAYVRAKAALYDSRISVETSHAILIERQVTLMERVEAARNLLFRHMRTVRERQMAAALIATLDTFEIILSSQTDYWLLRRQFAGQRDSGALLERIRIGVLHTALLIEDIADEIRDGRPSPSLHTLRNEFAAIAEKLQQVAPLEGDGSNGDTEHGAALLELRATLERIGHAVEAVDRLQQVIRQPAAAETVLAAIRIEEFLPPRPYRLQLVRRHLRLTSPIFRYALRLTAAMLCAFAIAAALTHYFSHGSWILLTVAVIMRASYSATRQRQKDRLVGNLIGCVLAAVALHLLSDPVLLALYFASIALAHAYAPVRYLITSTAACVMALLMMHFLSPASGSLLGERLLDTVIGAGIAALFSFVLPYWERQSLPQLTAALLRANRKYARQALKRSPPEQSYRLARKDLFDAGADFAGALRRLAAEPGATTADMTRLQAFLSANYRMMAQLAALHVLLRMRGHDLDPAMAENLLARHRPALLGLLGAETTAEATESPREATPARTEPDTGQWQMAAALMQRLQQAEAVARQISDLAAGLQIAPLRRGT
ncbi:FUSC family membrane protein [Ferrovibrio terrae]|uniref:FUSC family protein n=1 Tax=Ferrovibrio terrae TaxID=2594003 RepID=UPI0031382E3C